MTCHASVGCAHGHMTGSKVTAKSQTGVNVESETTKSSQVDSVRYVSDITNTTNPIELRVKNVKCYSATVLNDRISRTTVI